MTALKDESPICKSSESADPDFKAYNATWADAQLKREGDNLLAHDTQTSDFLDPHRNGGYRGEEGPGQQGRNSSGKGVRRSAATKSPLTRD